MQLILRWVISAAALYATVWILQILNLADDTSTHWFSWFVAVIIMALVNALIRPIAQLLTAPLNCLTFGLIGIVVNALLFWLVPVIMSGIGMPVFEVRFFGALLGSILVGLLGGFLSQMLIRRGEEDDRPHRSDR
jgi:putative membrane protein